MKIIKKINNLKKLINKHKYSYYVLDRPTIKDIDYDILLNKLIRLEQLYPELITPDSPTQIV